MLEINSRPFFQDGIAILLYIGYFLHCCTIKMYLENLFDHIIDFSRPNAEIGWKMTNGRLTVISSTGNSKIDDKSLINFIAFMQHFIRNLMQFTNFKNVK